MNKLSDKVTKLEQKDHKRKRKDFEENQVNEIEDSSPIKKGKKKVLKQRK